MRKLVATAVGAALLLATAGGAVGEPTGSQYVAATGADAAQLRLQLFYIADGMGWANVAAQYTYKVSLYCPPPALALSADQYDRILRDYVAARPAQAGNPIGSIMMIALQTKFPCP